MNDSSQNTPSAHAASAAVIEAKFDRVDELVSLLVDEAIEEPQVKELESLLTEDDRLRGRYVDGIQLHCDLMEYYKQDSKNNETPASPVLGFLGGEGSGLDLHTQPPQA